MRKTLTVVAGLAAIAAGCAALSGQDDSAQALAVMKASFAEHGQATLDRLQQDETQRLCSRPMSSALAPEDAGRISKLNMETIRYPADGKLLGDWREGEKIAQSGVGMQFSDDPTKPSGGNCYACHQLTRQEISFGTIGPSLYQFGKQRGADAAMQRYTFGKIWNAQAFRPCSNMPRFGHKGILSEKQIKDVTALLLDPNSPVNQ